MIRWICVIAVALFFSCQSLAAPIAERYKSPNEYAETKARISQEFELREMDESLAKYAYRFSAKPKSSIEKLSYEKFRGKRGKVVGTIDNGTGSPITGYFWQVEIEGEKFYAQWIPVAPAVIEGAYFLIDTEHARNLVGKKVWPIKQRLITPTKDVFVDVEHLDAVEIVGVDTKSYGHGSGGFSPFWLRVKTRDEREGLLPYDDRHFFLYDPIDRSWPSATVQLIKNRKIELGMTSEQVQLSWGKPQRINRTVTANAVVEQWVYGRQYVYIENGKVRSFQDSR